MGIISICKIIFWASAFCVAYAYLIYPLLIALIAIVVKNKQQQVVQNAELPHVTLLITAYNEEKCVASKVQNSQSLNYPAEKLHQVWVTDGSTDNTNALLSTYNDVVVYFQPERAGKVNAMQRALQYVDTDIVIFSDANTMLSIDSVIEIVKLMQDKRVGCVAGEKCVLQMETNNAASLGESAYWRYESWIKRNDACVGSTIGAAGELFAFRKSLFVPVADNTILDDFEISLRIALLGYTIAYSSKACAIEKPSVNIDEEMKRKVRIAAGSIQSMVRLTALLNFFKHPMLTFQYVSHKIFRWVIVPVCLPILLITNGLLSNCNSVYLVLFVLQLLFYVLAFVGHIFRNRKNANPLIHIPYYFYLANKAMWMGAFRYFRGSQSVKWERAQRAD